MSKNKRDIDEIRKNMNKERCMGHSCQYCVKNYCSLLDTHITNADVCVFDIARKNNFVDNSAEYFMMQNNPYLFLSYLSYRRKHILPVKNTKVITLRSGFGGYAGCIRYVNGIVNNSIELRDNDNRRYISLINDWYKDFFAMDNYN